jgi:hypothetical protein
MRLMDREKPLPRRRFARTAARLPVMPFHHPVLIVRVHSQYLDHIG